MKQKSGPVCGGLRNASRPFGLRPCCRRLCAFSSPRERAIKAEVPGSRSRFEGFSLIELLVALAIFATMAALAYGGLDSIVRTRAALGREQVAFASLMRGVALIERDLRQAAARPVRGSYGEILPAFVGAPDRLELTRIGFANPQAEMRSNLERVFYVLDGGVLERGNYPVLDRAPASAPLLAKLRDAVAALRLRYLDGGGRWSDTWPPLAAAATDAPPLPLPRAVEFRIDTPDYGEITRIVELVSPWPLAAVEAAGPAS